MKRRFKHGMALVLALVMCVCTCNFMILADAPAIVYLVNEDFNDIPTEADAATRPIPQTSTWGDASSVKIVNGALEHVLDSGVQKNMELTVPLMPGTGTTPMPRGENMVEFEWKHNTTQVQVYIHGKKGHVTKLNFSTSQVIINTGSTTDNKFKITSLNLRNNTKIRMKFDTTSDAKTVLKQFWIGTDTEGTTNWTPKLSSEIDLPAAGDGLDYAVFAPGSGTTAVGGTISSIDYLKTWQSAPSQLAAYMQDPGAALAFDDIKGGNTAADEVKQDLDLSKMETTNGLTIVKWKSSNENVIATNGAVTPAFTDTNVTLTPVLGLVDVTGEGTDGYVTADGAAIDVTVPADDLGAVQQAADALTFDVIKGSNTSADSVTKELVLSKEGSNGTAIAWTASPEGVIDPDTGAVTRPAFGQTDAVVTLTAAVSKNGQNAQQQIVVTVPAAEAQQAAVKFLVDEGFDTLPEAGEAATRPVPKVAGWSGSTAEADLTGGAVGLKLTAGVQSKARMEIPLLPGTGTAPVPKGENMVEFAWQNNTDQVWIYVQTANQAGKYHMMYLECSATDIKVYRYDGSNYASKATIENLNLRQNTKIRMMFDTTSETETLLKQLWIGADAGATTTWAPKLSSAISLPSAGDGLTYLNFSGGGGASVAVGETVCSIDYIKTWQSAPSQLAAYLQEPGAALAFDDIKGENTAATGVTKNLDFSKTLTNNGLAILNWKSSDSTVIDAGGVVTPAGVDREITLTPVLGLADVTGEGEGGYVKADGTPILVTVPAAVEQQPEVKFLVNEAFDTMPEAGEAATRPIPSATGWSSQSAQAEAEWKDGTVNLKVVQGSERHMNMDIPLMPGDGTAPMPRGENMIEFSWQNNTNQIWLYVNTANETNKKHTMYLDCSADSFKILSYVGTGNGTLITTISDLNLREYTKIRLLIDSSAANTTQLKQLWIGTDAQGTTTWTPKLPSAVTLPDVGDGLTKLNFAGGDGGSTPVGSYVCGVDYVKTWQSAASQYAPYAQAPAAAVAFNDIKGDNTAAENVTANLALSAVTETGNGYPIVKWQSSNESVIAADGTVHRARTDKTVTLTPMLGFPDTTGEGENGYVLVGGTPIVVTVKAGDGGSTVSGTITARPATGLYRETKTVTLSAADGAEIYYTTNNLMPDETSTKYTGPITVDKTTNICAISVKNGVKSEPVTLTYIIKGAEEPLMSFVTLSDIHIDSHADDERMATAFDVIESICPNPDALVLPGDLINDNHVAHPEQPDRSADHAIVVDILQKEIAERGMNDAEVVVAMGNHDAGVTKMLEYYPADWFPAANYHKVIGGYHFLVLNTESVSGAQTFAQEKLNEITNNGTANMDQPIFVVLHRPITGTINRNRDAGGAGLFNVFKNFPQTVVLSGHSHKELNDETSIWQGDFTAMLAGSMQYLYMTPGFIMNTENRGATAYHEVPVAQACLVEVFADRMEVDRIGMEVDKADCTSGSWTPRPPFVNKGTSIGPRWTIPTGADMKANFPYTEAKQKAQPVPSFAGGTQAVVTENEGKLSVTFDQAQDVQRVFYYQIDLRSADGSTVNTFNAYAEQYFSPVPAKMTYPVVDKSTLTGGTYHVEVRAADSFYQTSAPIVSEDIVVQENPDAAKFAYLANDNFDFDMEATATPDFSGVQKGDGVTEYKMTYNDNGTAKLSAADGAVTLENNGKGWNAFDVKVAPPGKDRVFMEVNIKTSVMQDYGAFLYVFGNGGNHILSFGGSNSLKYADSGYKTFSPNQTMTAGSFKKIRMLYDFQQKTVTYYVNDMAVGTTPVAISMTDLTGFDMRFHSNITTKQTLSLDYFRLWQPVADQLTEKAASAALGFDDIKGTNTSQTHVAADLDLSKQYTENGLTILGWESSNPDVIDADGKVLTVPAGETEVNLTPILGLYNKEKEPAQSGGDVTVDAEYARIKGTPVTVTVTASQPENDVQQAVAELTFDAIKGENADAAHVKTDLVLSTEGKYGTAVAWSAAPAGVIDPQTGKVTRPAFGQPDASVTLTAAVSKNGTSQNVTIPVTVLAETQDVVDVRNAAAALAFDAIKGENPDAAHVTSNLVLSGTGENGTAVAWTAAPAGVVEPQTGTVTRPAYGQPDAAVTLTATISKNGESTAKDIVVTVLAEDTAPAQRLSYYVDEAFETLPTADDADTRPVIKSNGWSGKATATAKAQDGAAQLILVSGALGSTQWDVPLMNGTGNTSMPRGENMVEFAFKMNSGVTSIDIYVPGSSGHTMKFRCSKTSMTVRKSNTGVANDAQFTTVATVNGLNLAGSAYTVVRMKFDTKEEGKTNLEQLWVDGTPQLSAPAEGLWDAGAGLRQLNFVPIAGSVPANGAVFTIDYLKTWQSSASQLAAMVQAPGAELTFDDIKGANTNVSSVTEDLDFETVKETANGLTVLGWKSSNETVIAPDGSVTRIRDFQNVLLTPILGIRDELGEADGGYITADGKPIMVTVAGDAGGMSEVDIAAELLTFDTIKGNNTNADSITKDLTLPTAGVYDTEISWKADPEGVVSTPGGVVKRPSGGAPSVNVTLTATVSKGQEKKEKTFHITVVAIPKEKITTNAKLTEGSAPEFIYDGLMNTALSVQGSVRSYYVLIDLGELMPVSQTVLYEGQTDGAYPITEYSIETSADNKTWTKVASGTQVGEKKTDDFAPSLVRYVRLNVTGKTSGAVSELYEMEINNNPADAARVKADAAALEADIPKTITASPLALPKVGPFGSTVTWSSDNGLISPDGAVTFSSDTKAVVLTATITYGKETETKLFPRSIQGTGGGSGGGSSGGGGSSRPGGSGGAAGSVSPALPVENPQVNPNPNPNPGQDGFADMDSAAWAAEYVQRLAYRGVLKGDGSGNFRPNDSMTREEFVKVLVSGLNIAPGEQAASAFADVPQDAWYYDTVQVALSAGIVNGIGDGVFGTGQTVTREDMVTMIARALAYQNITLKGGTPAALADAADIADYAQQAAAMLAQAGIITGDEQGNFQPKRSATRAEVAKIVCMILDQTGE